MASSAEMGAIEVSPEMLTLWGVGGVGRHRWPPRTVAFVLDEQCAVRFLARPTLAAISTVDFANRIILLVDRSACERLLDGPLGFDDGATYRVPAQVRAIALALRDCTMIPAAAEPYRLAKSIELLCEILGAATGGQLLPEASEAMSFADSQRIAAARRLIDENWQEPLTLSHIARRCGLNRSKLSRGFRALYRCTVSEALTDRRLGEARRQLIATDLPVGLIGYRSGYQNNASFSRAFSRHFGVAPSDFRMKALAA